MLIGAHYFSGWWRPLPNKWRADEKDVLEEHPGRRPVLGKYISPSSLENEIGVASEYGVDFFNFLWYGTSIQEPSPRDAVQTTDLEYLNSALEFFVTSANSHQLSFSIEWVNHGPWAVVTDQEWEDLVERWIEIFLHPAYLKVEEKLVFKIHSWHYWAVGTTRAATREARLSYLRRRVKEACGRRMMIGAGVRRLEPIVSGHPIMALREFDFTGIYLDVPGMVVDAPDALAPGRYPYSQLQVCERIGRAYHAYDTIPFLPSVVCGFDPVWDFQAHLPRYAEPTRGEWSATLDAVAADLELFPRFGFPSDRGPCHKAFTIYAWNEYAEGGILTPTEAGGYWRLECIKELKERNT